MQLDLSFRDIPAANVWERLDAKQRTAVIQALSQLMVKMTKQEPKEENRNVGHE